MYMTWTNLWLPCKLLGGCHGKEVDAIKWNLVCPWRLYVHNNGFNSSTLWRGRWFGDEKCEIIRFSGGWFWIFWDTVMYITYSCIVANDHKRHQQHSSQYFWTMLHQIVNLFGIHGVSKRNAPLVSCRYFWIMLHQVVDMFGIHGVSVTLLEVINIFK